VPELDFAVVSLSNAGPHGIPFNETVVRWAVEMGARAVAGSNPVCPITRKARICGPLAFAASIASGTEAVHRTYLTTRFIDIATPCAVQ
jgi:hypothetical protein